MGKKKVLSFSFFNQNINSTTVVGFRSSDRGEAGRLHQQHLLHQRADHGKRLLTTAVDCTLLWLKWRSS